MQNNYPCSNLRLSYGNFSGKNLKYFSGFIKMEHWEHLLSFTQKSETENLWCSIWVFT